MVLFPSRGVTCCRAHRMWCVKWLKTREGALQRRGIFSDNVCVNFTFLWCSSPHCSLEKTPSPDSSDKMNLVWEETKASKQKWNTNRMQMCPRTKHNGRRLLLLWHFCSRTPLCSPSGFISSAVQYCFSCACHSGICNPAWSAGVYRNKGFKTAVGSSQVFFIFLLLRVAFTDIISRIGFRDSTFHRQRTFSAFRFIIYFSACVTSSSVRSSKRCFFVWMRLLCRRF